MTAAQKLLNDNSHTVPLDADAIGTHLQDRTHNRIRSLVVSIEPGRLLISGTTSSYYEKAKAVNAVREIVESGNLIEMELMINIKVAATEDTGSGYYDSLN